MASDELLGIYVSLVTRVRKKAASLTRLLSDIHTLVSDGQAPTQDVEDLFAEAFLALEEM